MSCRSGCQCNSNGDATNGINAVAPAALSLGAGKSVGTSKGIALAQLGQMLGYPDEDFFAKLERLACSVRTAYPNSAKPLKKFQDYCKDMTRADMEELYTRTFDLAAIASPYITGYIYGDENFDRGTLMATLSENYARLGFDMEGELPDHLALMLRFSSWLDEEALDELINYCLQKPVKEMCEQLRNCDNPYFFLLSAIDTVLHSAQSGESKS
jgi:nitrate reductase delta subunit